MTRIAGKLRPLMGPGKRVDWNTPAEVLDALSPLGPIRLDPCSNPRSIVLAARRIDLRTGRDGLTADWARGYGPPGLVYVNPPYGRAIGQWIAKCCAEAPRCTGIVALVPARVDARWFIAARKGGARVRFWEGRITFRGAKHAAPFPSALLYWGPRPDVFQTLRLTSRAKPDYLALFMGG